MSKTRGFCFTFNTFDEDTETWLQESVEAQYLVYGYELAPTTGRPHFQGYVYFHNPRTLSGVRKDFAGAHVEEARGAPEQNFDYCSKDGLYFQRGKRPMSQKEKGAAEEDRWREARQFALAGEFANIPDDLYIRYQSSFKRIRREDVKRPDDLAPRATYGVWIWGPSGTGKSHMARTQYGDVYLKDLNKWWDGYDQEKNVVIDEIAPEHAVYMTSFIKRWADRWAFSAEMKGGRTVIRPNLLIITSNYSVDQVFAQYPIDLEAIRRRFEVVHLTEVYHG